jgi:hypothetical protein
MCYTFGRFLAHISQGEKAKRPYSALQQGCCKKAADICYKKLAFFSKQLQSRKKAKPTQNALQAGQNKKPPEPLAMHTIKVPEVINSAANQRKRSG